MRKSTASGLLAIVLGAVVVRLAPLGSFVFWGSDTGEYFALLRGLVRTGRLSTAYAGWGVTYPYFPGMFLLDAAFVDLGGLSIPVVLNLVVPILGALGVAPLFLIGMHMTKEHMPALFAAAFLAGAIPHAYTTAHPAPATLGSLLALTGLLMFLRLRRDRTAAVPLLLITAALIVTHHLSLYFFLAMVLGTIVLRGLVVPSRPTARVTREVAYAFVLVGGTFAYWFGYASTFRDLILTDVSVRPWWLLLAAFPIGLAALAGLIYVRARIPWRYRPRYPTHGGRAWSYAAALGTILAIGLVAIVAGVPGTNFRVNPADLLFFAPLALLMPFAAVGRKFADFLQDGTAPSAWLVVLLLSAVVGIVAAPRVLIPFRHAEYLMIPFAILAGLGFVRWLDLTRPRRRMRAMALGVSGLLLGVSLLTAMPPPETFGGWREGTVPEALSAAYWAREHASGLVVSDHQGSTTVFGFGGIDATWDRTAAPFLPENAADPYAGLARIPSPSGEKDGTYVWIDRDMEAGVRLAPWETADPMHPTVLAKFKNAPFIKVFDNGYARLYWIAWGCPTTC